VSDSLPQDPAPLPTPTAYDSTSTIRALSERGESWSSSATMLRRIPPVSSGAGYTSVRMSAEAPVADSACAFDRHWLLANKEPRYPRPVHPPVGMIDLFSGCGALSLGATDALRSLGVPANQIAAVDTDEAAVSVYERNFEGVRSFPTTIDELIDGELHAGTTERERALLRDVSPPDLLLGGPPCQGHSDLNNHTRRRDPKNALYLRMVRAAEIFEPSVVVIENVPGVRHDRGSVVDRAMAALKKLGYHIEAPCLLDAARFGVPQHRRRFFLIATKPRLPVAFHDVLSSQIRPLRTVRWAIADLRDARATATFDQGSKVSDDNRARMTYLLENDEYDLPDHLRPPCHSDGGHTYRSVYGRLHWDRPAQTITTGFGSMGQGRFMHPELPRTLTPHEAARLQSIPDYFHFGNTNRGNLQRMIGNAVPPLLARAVVFSIYAGLLGVD
jgi:DNA (cytosine-5)-methyltransferase 1